MSRILANFDRSLDAQERACGSRPTATVGDIGPIDCLLSSIGADLIHLAGGSAESGDHSLQMRLSDFPDGAPAKNTPVSITGRSEENLAVLEVAESHGVLTLTVGDPAA